MIRCPFLLVFALTALLTACDSQREPVATGSDGTAAGEVLGGTISDEMIALEQLRSQAPLAPPQSRSAAEVDAEQPRVTGLPAPAGEGAAAGAAPAPAPTPTPSAAPAPAPAE